MKARNRHTVVDRHHSMFLPSPAGTSPVNYWKIYCMESHWPGLWRRCFQRQAASVGWPPSDGYTLEGKSRSKAWSRVRNALRQVQVGDKVVLQLQGNRIGRIGEVVRVRIADNQWDPLVPRSKQEPTGEMGRQLHVRWDLVNGPSDPDLVVHLPVTARPSRGLLRVTMCRLPPRTFGKIAKAMSDRKNWVPISPHIFRYEESISDYLATYPHYLEDGLQPYPSKRVRETVFSDRTRADVLLIDRYQKPVIVECKQGNPTIANINQLRGYMRKAERVIGKPVRGLLVHGGASKLTTDVKRHSLKHPRIEIVRYSFSVSFAQTL